jgi:hypothetical protein
MLWHGEISSFPELHSIVSELPWQILRSSRLRLTLLLSSVSSERVGARCTRARLDEAAAKLMAAGVVWHVPASSPIADDDRGRDRVPSYLRHRRRLAGDHLRVTRNITKRARNS